MNDLEKERRELENALEEAFQDPMIQLGTAVYESREHLPDVLQKDLEAALEVGSEVSLDQAEPDQVPDRDQDLDRDF